MSRSRAGRQVSYRQAVTAYLPVPPSAAVVQRGGKTGQEIERRELLRLLHVRFLPRKFSSIYRRTAAAITAAMITIAPTINQFLPILRVLVARYSCCCRSWAALCAVHRVSFSCWVSLGSAMVFPCAIRAVVVCGLMHPILLPSFPFAKTQPPRTAQGQVVSIRGNYRQVGSPAYSLTTMP